MSQPLLPMNPISSSLRPVDQEDGASAAGVAAVSIPPDSAAAGSAASTSEADATAGAASIGAAGAATSSLITLPLQLVLSLGWQRHLHLPSFLDRTWQRTPLDAPQPLLAQTDLSRRSLQTLRRSQRRKPTQQTSWVFVSIPEPHAMRCRVCATNSF